MWFQNHKRPADIFCERCLQTHWKRENTRLQNFWNQNKQFSRLHMTIEKWNNVCFFFLNVKLKTQFLGWLKEWTTCEFRENARGLLSCDSCNQNMAGERPGWSEWCNSVAIPLRIALMRRHSNSAALCGRRTFPEAGLQSKHYFTLARARAVKKKISSQHAPPLSPPSFPSTASQPLARRQEETWGTAHNSARSATRERAQKIQTTFNSCYWMLIGFGCQRGLPIIRRCDFFFCLTDHETSSSIEEQIHPLRKKKQKNTKIKPLLL